MVELRDDPLAAAFAELRAEATAALRPPGAAAARAAGRRATRRRRTLAAALVGLVSAGIGTGVALAPAAGPDRLEPVPHPTAPTPSADPTRPTLRRVDVGNATIDLTALPGCGGTVRTFSGGRVTDGDLAVDLLDPRAYGDLDADGREEVVVVLSCLAPGAQRSTEVLAVLAPAGRPTGSLTVLGTSPALSDATAFDGLSVSGGTVRVAVRNPYASGAEHQRRSYRWRDGRLTQVAGPAAFPRPLDLLGTDWPNATVRIGPDADDPCGAGQVTFRNGVARTSAGTYQVDPSPEVGDLDGDGLAEAVLALTCTPATGTAQGGFVVVRPRADGTRSTVGTVFPARHTLRSVTVENGELVAQFTSTDQPTGATARRYDLRDGTLVQVAGPPG